MPPRWASHERGPYIRLWDGQKFFLKDPRPDDFRPLTMAHHLARIHRFTGASEISVAQHCSVAAMMAERFYPDQKLLPARMLIHDGTEFAYGDCSSPLKYLLPDYRALERHAEGELEKAMDMTFLCDPLVGEVDTRMWLTERLPVFAGARKCDPDLDEEDYDGPLTAFPLDARELRMLFEPWGAERAEYEWLAQLEERLPWVVIR